MSNLALSGLASGVDTSGIIDQLMAVDRTAVTALQNKQTTATAHQTAIKAVSDKLSALQTAAAALTDSTTWKTTQTASSSDSSKVGVSIIDGAGIGGHSLTVDRLAPSAPHRLKLSPRASTGTRRA